MRPALYATALLALAAAIPPQQIAASLASVASILIEALPFLAFGSLASVLGCGCGRAGARALPVIAFTWVQFGPLVALARAAAAFTVARIIERGHSHDHRATNPGDELLALLPSAILAVIISQVAGKLGVIGGLALGFAGAPCALGGVALAASLRGHAPAVAIAVLCTSGVLDARTVFSLFSVRRTEPNGLVDVAAALVCAVTAYKHGAQLVHPLWSVPLALAAVAYAYRAWTNRRRGITPALVPLGLALGALVVTVPAPEPAAHETTLADVYVGERLDFTGRLVRRASMATLERYAITCCRADAQPVVVRLTRAPSTPEGTWLRVRGTIVRNGTRLALAASTTTVIAPPADPFIYR